MKTDWWRLEMQAKERGVREQDPGTGAFMPSMEGLQERVQYGLNMFQGLSKAGGGGDLPCLQVELLAENRQA